MLLEQFVKFPSWLNKTDIYESTKKFTEYLTKAYYSIPQNENQQLILNIDNKGSKDNFAVGNIRIENFKWCGWKYHKKIYWRLSNSKEKR